MQFSSAFPGLFRPPAVRFVLKKLPPSGISKSYLAKGRTKHSMRRLFLLTTLALIVSNIAIGPGTTLRARASGSELAYAPGEVIVKLKRGAADLRHVTATLGSADSNLALKDADEEPLARLGGAGRLDEIIARHGLDRTFVLKVGQDADIAQTIARLKADDAVEYAEPNYLIKPGSFIPDDPKFSEQWALRNLGLGVT